MNHHFSTDELRAAANAVIIAMALGTPIYIGHLIGLARALRAWIAGEENE